MKTFLHLYLRWKNIAHPFVILFASLSSKTNKKAASTFPETITKNVAQNFGNFNFSLGIFEIKEESANSLLRRKLQRHIVHVFTLKLFAVFNNILIFHFFIDENTFFCCRDKQEKKTIERGKRRQRVQRDS